MKPTLSFDTSGINRLIDSRITSTPALAAIQSAYRVRLTATSVDELIADRDPTRRAQLLDVAKALLPNADVILSFHELLRSHVLAYGTRRDYDWHTVAVEDPDYRREIALREILTDELSEEQRNHAIQVAEEFETIYADARPHFDAIFARYPDQARPPVEDVLEAFQQPGGSFWEMAARLLSGLAGTVPRRVLCGSSSIFALPSGPSCMRWFWPSTTGVIAEKADSELAKLAGRVDVFSATFLPYCAIFVSDDRDQQRFLRKVVELTGATTEVHWFNTFLDRIGVGSQCLAMAAGR